MIKNMKIGVILPAYNEEEKIGSLVADIYKVLGPEAEILVVDDASSDSTAEKAQEAGARVISHPYNLGNGAAVKTGLREARGDIVVLMDADGQHRPEDIPLLLEDMDRYDMVIGARGRGSRQVFWRRMANYIYNWLASYVSGRKILDLTSGFRAMKRDAVRHYIYLLPNTFSYPSTLTLSFIKSGRPVKFVPIKVLPRREGRSKINLLQDGVRFFLIITKIATLFSPLKIFLPLSLLFFLAGLSYYLYTFLHFHRFTNMSALLLTTAVTIFMLGLIAEQIAFLRMERTEEE